MGDSYLTAQGSSPLLTPIFCWGAAGIFPSCTVPMAPTEPRVSLGMALPKKPAPLPSTLSERSGQVPPGWPHSLAAPLARGFFHAHTYACMQEVAKLVSLRTRLLLLPWRNHHIASRLVQKSHLHWKHLSVALSPGQGVAGCLSLGPWRVSMKRVMGVTKRAKWGWAHLQLSCTYKHGGDTQAVCCCMPLGGLGGERPPGASPVVAWLVAPLWQRRAGGAARQLRKIELFSEGRGDTHTPVIGNTSVTAWSWFCYMKGWGARTGPSPDCITSWLPC